MTKYKYSKTNQKNGYPRRINKTYDCLPEHAKWLLYENQVKLHEIKPINIMLEAKISTGVDALKYLGPANHFVCKRFSITREQLELFLFIYPFNYFTRRDFNRLAPVCRNGSLSYLIKKGLVIPIYKKENLIVPEGKKKDLADIYTLSLDAKRSVNYFYKVLSGELKPYRFQNSEYTKSDTKNKLIKDLLDEMKHKK